ncbi:UDP-N-acetylmuramate:L-alanyl-gamma-D-glutamyl-meso-diaminopimelate ligase [Vibrio sp. SS-MA-C1-2]|uniref:UDP-N-acetylmuramate:L-alanyl-gamma-D-glutamyl- meso-diaminopimelate ligase n=1 Tax=Vibrio sp. SS-MA-C1-2 TaxID=2908646 RepID=UPI001F270349|nr:UDP-N-acetylmuramate:L-alanyl-gamma-D-glutamyl-meso-diaminopimelate ligase [Vibrio sp. SS-MA-C1-2]UJF19561.1 UDP-N-acetylmuramate:L-alanyl-gamma-D-glutamyl-meso-diaminopimelate ligase [Vibrio sp. SS-MA-C1-2]
MHIHILGICGTFMGGAAILAKELGHKVTGSDTNVYPPMSTLLESKGVEIIQGYDPSQLEPAPDLVVIGNALSRGNPCVEYVLNQGLRYDSGPKWLFDFLLKDRWVLAVAGTHGKTSTASMLAWILEDCGYQPGYLIGGVPGNFDVSARLGNTPFFVVEADEYDSAFFDKRSKFVHYHPRTLIINNLEFDHGDIFNDISDIQRQFHHLIRTIPSEGRILAPLDNQNVAETIEMGCWSELESSGETGQWQSQKVTADGSEFEILFDQQVVGKVKWSLIGEHNMANARMAVAAARHVGVTPDLACQSLETFINAKRRLELRGCVNNISVYDDFAHHPTAIQLTLEGLRAKVGEQRIFAVLEPRSNTMKSGVFNDKIAPALELADQVFFYQDDHLSWSLEQIKAECQQPTEVYNDIDKLVMAIKEQAQPEDHILVMSNGGFGGIHLKLLKALGRE